MPRPLALVDLALALGMVLLVTLEVDLDLVVALVVVCGGTALAMLEVERLEIRRELVVYEEKRQGQEQE